MNWLLTPGGVSQLLTQIAALRYTQTDVTQIRVFSVCYYWGPEMATAIQQTCDAFGIEYLGNIEPLAYHPGTLRTSSLADRFTWRLSPQAYHKKLLVRKGWTTPPNTSGLVVCLRPWVYDELLIHSVLRPEKLLCAIDGIAPRSPNRSLQGDAWKGLDAPFRDIPTRCHVYCPEYLTADANLLGIAEAIPDKIERDLFSRYRDTPLAQQFGNLLQEYVGGQRTVAIIFSQQLAQSGYLNAKQEVQYYLDAVDALKRRGYESIILKQHPRDPKDKLAAIEAATSRIKGVVVVPNDLSCVPIEPFLDDFGDSQLLGVSTNSTVLLSFRALTSANALSFDSPNFTCEFRRDRDSFCLNHGVEVVIP